MVPCMDVSLHFTILSFGAIFSEADTKMVAKAKRGNSSLILTNIGARR